MLIKSTPWDAVAFGIPTWELLEYSATALKQASRTPGHYTLRVNPLADRRQLYEYGYYYCDTLIEPSCDLAKLHMTMCPEATISKGIDSAQALKICHGAFTHDRFHRDFNIPKAAADLRYDNWLKQMLDAEQVYGLYWKNTLAGFIGYIDNNLALHALAKEFRGKGLSKYWWSAVCTKLLENGHENVKSSISVNNLAVLKLYISLGFSFSNPQDIYHHLVS